MNRRAPQPRHGHDAGCDERVQAALSALSRDESRVAHAARLAGVVRDAATDTAERLELFRRILTLDSRVARQVALDVADDPRAEVRLAACGVLASTSGSEDDLPRLLSLMADQRMSDQRRALQNAADAVRAPDPDESLGLLLRLVELPADGGGISIQTLVPAQPHRPQFVRWTNKAWHRAADHRRAHRFLEAAQVLAGIVVDQAILRAAATGNRLGLTQTELDQVNHALRGRPTPLQLMARSAIAERYPWIAVHADLATVAGQGSVSSAPRMSVLGARDIATATASLRVMVQGWLGEVRLRG